jgi:response regulator RpfG family c-di-GMP phosphodiesterase
MPEQPIALVVDDDKEWLDILEDILESDYKVLKAKTFPEVNKIIANKDWKIEIALVDIKLDEAKPGDDSGLLVMFSLNKKGIPCIAATSIDHGEAIRAALLTGRAKDVWFKSERTVVLKDKVANIEKRLGEERKDAIKTINFNKEFLRLVFALLLIPFVVLTLLVATVFFLPNNYLIVIGIAIGLILAIFGLLALFYNKITGEQFIQLIKISQNQN